MSIRPITEKRIILALDHMDASRAIELTELLGGYIYAVKIHHLFLREGKGIVDKLKVAGGMRVWVDLKLYDTPDTVAMETIEIADNGADIVSVHASGGVHMMRKAVAEIERVYAVTLLTSFFEDEVNSSYGQQSDYVIRQLACDAVASGAIGIVAPARNIKLLRSEPATPGVEAMFKDIEWITPGIRCKGTDYHDQVQVVTPEEAILAGASKLVIGREITQALNPLGKLDRIARDIEKVLQFLA